MRERAGGEVDPTTSCSSRVAAEKQSALARRLEGVAQEYALKQADVVKAAGRDPTSVENVKDLERAVVTACDAAKGSATSLEGALALVDDQ
ncbi:hypothetical protein [Saccharopolyspora mangrovi]|uniref:Uncharacterized protein n=1 Tax=Saccharopolyspora mangrovi TaxID=3082379 RepID=A0ABU6A991_9PSEU|nr:hypothetical protein [Saccharopolyspora sp. S2-29]MEB3368075.1 hypothetical protein [Saccharopolyspora sp. S2-29]